MYDSALNNVWRLANRNKAPCYGCTKRYPACQDVCPELAKARAESAKAREAERIALRTENDLLSGKLERIRAQKKRYGKRR